MRVGGFSFWPVNDYREHTVYSGLGGTGPQQVVRGTDHHVQAGTLRVDMSFELQDSADDGADWAL